jgi:hypothetical protein
MANVVELTTRGPAYCWAFAPECLALGVRPMAESERAQIGVHDLHSPNIVHPIPPTDALGLVPGTVLAAVNPMFAFAPGDGHDWKDTDQGYRSSKAYRLRALHRDPANGIDAPGDRPDGGLVIAVQDGKALAFDGTRHVPAGIVAVQTYPTLVHDGHPVDVQDLPDRSGKAALCILRDGRLAIIGGHMSMHDLRAACIALGAVWAGYLDGGGSFCVRHADGRVWGGNLHRRLASWILVVKR